MNPSQSAPLTAPTRRDLRSPYFIFRTLDGTGTYFTAENLPIVLSPKEPLSRFLAPARVVEAGGVRSISYDLAAIQLDTARPMEFLPQSEIDAFAEAVRAFYDKAHEAAQRIVPYEKRLRAHFRLPDPELEADAYWVYGPAHDRRLLILWGCELKAGTSLPLAPDDLKRVAVIGPNAARPCTQGGGAAHISAPYAVTPLEGLRAALGKGLGRLGHQAAQFGEAAGGHVTSGLLVAAPILPGWRRIGHRLSLLKFTRRRRRGNGLRLRGRHDPGLDRASLGIGL